MPPTQVPLRFSKNATSYTLRLAHRARPAVVHQRRNYADNNAPRQGTDPIRHPPEKEKKGPNMDQLPHVSQEAEAMSRIKGETPPDITAGTHIKEMAKRDPEAEESLPEVMKNEMKGKTLGTVEQQQPAGSGQKRQFSTLARRLANSASDTASSSADTTTVPVTAQSAGVPQDAEAERSRAILEATGMDESIWFSPHTVRLPEGLDPEAELVAAAKKRPGLKFPLPEGFAAGKPGMHLKNRADPLIEQVTKLIMKDGKLSHAQRYMSEILSYLRLSPAPRGPNPTQSRAHLVPVPEVPSLAALPLYPVAYMGLAIDSIAPLFRMRSIKGAAGGGVALQIPKPLNVRQRRRLAVGWILDAAERKGRTSAGVVSFPKRFADELVAIVEGRSALWEKRGQLHSLGVRARANLDPTKLRTRRN